MIIHFLILLASLVVLGIASHYLVTSSVHIAQRFNLSQMFIGLTLVAWGTSAPEIAVSVSAALQGKGDLSVGNVIGSNIFNLGFILGIVALVFPQKIRKKMVYRDGMVLLTTTFLVLFFLWDRHVAQAEGLVLLMILLSYGVYLFVKKDVEVDEVVKEIEKEKSTVWSSVLLFVVSLYFLVKASDMTVESAVAIARTFGISEWAIGATIVAAGTSLPEVATSVMATFKRQFDISIGNVIGSDIFNALGIIGISSVLAPITMKSNVSIFGLPDFAFSQIMLIATLILILIFMRSGWRLSRAEGGILFVIAVGRMGFEIYMGSV